MSQLARPPQTVAEVRKDLEATRKRLASSADAIRGDLRQGVTDLRRAGAVLKQKLNWKSWVARHPYASVLGAAAVGVFLGSRRRS